MCSSAHACAAVQCSEHGLNTHEVDRRLDEHGPNRLPESKRNPWLVFFGYMWGSAFVQPALCSAED